MDYPKWVNDPSNDDLNSGTVVNSAKEEEAYLRQFDAAEDPVKRGRGRPPKDKTEE